MAETAPWDSEVPEAAPWQTEPPEKPEFSFGKASLRQMRQGSMEEGSAEDIASRFRGITGTVLPAAGQMIGAPLGALAGAPLGAGAGFVLAGPPGVFGGGLAGIAAGTVAGGAGGYATGKTLAKLINHAVLGDDIANAYKEVPSDVLEGLAFEAGGKAVQTIPGLVKAAGLGVGRALRENLGESISYGLKENMPKIQQAINQLRTKIPSFELPRAFTTSNQGYQKLEQSVGQSGSIAASPYRNQYDTFYKDMDSAKKIVTDLKTEDVDFDHGAGIRNEINNIIGGNQKLTNDLYSQVAPELQHIGINPQVSKDTFDALGEDSFFKSDKGKKMMNEVQGIVNNTSDLNSLKEFRSSIHQYIDPADNASKVRVKKLYDAITDIRDGSILATKNDLPTSMHGEVDNFLKGLQDADANHAQTLKELNQLSPLIGAKDAVSLSHLDEMLDKIPNEEIGKRAGKVGTQVMQSLKNNPQTNGIGGLFDQVVQAKTNSLITTSSTKDGLSLPSFWKKYNGMGQQMRDLMFTPGEQRHIQAMHVIDEEWPEILGKSGTPEGLKRGETFSPQQNIKDVGNRLLLNYLQKEGTGELSMTPIRDAVINRAKYIPPGIAPAAGVLYNQNQDYETPKSGPDKWSSDGYDKIIQHMQGGK